MFLKLSFLKIDNQKLNSKNKNLEEDAHTTDLGKDAHTSFNGHF